MKLVPVRYPRAISSKNPSSWWLSTKGGRVHRKRRRRSGERLGRFVAPMVMINRRPADVADRRIAGHWEGRPDHRQRQPVGDRDGRRAHHALSPAAAPAGRPRPRAGLRAPSPAPAPAPRGDGFTNLRTEMRVSTVAAPAQAASAPAPRATPNTDRAASPIPAGLGPHGHRG